VQVERPAAASIAYSGPRSAIAVGKFDNRSTYMRGLFSDGIDRLGGQAKTILVGHLQKTGRFDVLDRDNMEENAREAQLSGKQQRLQGVAVIITGDVVEFGRKETGDEQLFASWEAASKQLAYSKVTLNVVDVITSRVVYSVSGAGEYALSNREVIGFGGTAGYDSTLNGKVLDSRSAKQSTALRKLWTREPGRQPASVNEALRLARCEHGRSCWLCHTTQPLYLGNYEELIYASYVTPGKLPPESQVEILEKDYQQSRAANKRMPPGWHAPLGYLYYQLGKPDEARRELSTEKAEFPESGTFMDRLLANLQKP